MNDEIRIALIVLGMALYLQYRLRKREEVLDRIQEDEQEEVQEALTRLAQMRSMPVIGLASSPSIYFNYRVTVEQGREDFVGELWMEGRKLKGLFLHPLMRSSSGRYLALARVPDDRTPFLKRSDSKAYSIILIDRETNIVFETVFSLSATIEIKGVDDEYVIVLVRPEDQPWHYEWLDRDDMVVIGQTHRILEPLSEANETPEDLSRFGSVWKRCAPTQIDHEP